MKKGIKLVLSILLVFVLIVIVDLVFLKINNKHSILESGSKLFSIHYSLFLYLSGAKLRCFSHSHNTIRVLFAYHKHGILPKNTLKTA